MTPKEKANYLICKYINCQNVWYLNNLYDGQRISQAKEYTLVLINEIKKEFKHNRLIYWEQVQKEIEKI